MQRSYCYCHCNESQASYVEEELHNRKKSENHGFPQASSFLSCFNEIKNDHGMSNAKRMLKSRQIS
jgi:hypothetical protein